MESKKISFNLYTLKNGFVLALTLIIFDLILYIFKAPVNSPFQWVNLLIILAFIIYATINYRNKYCNGFISYGRSLISCFLITFYGGIIFAVYKYFFLKYFDYSVVINIKDFARQKLSEYEYLDEEKIDQIMDMQKWLYTPLVLSIGAIINYAFWGLIFSLIASIFIKKEDTSFEAATNAIDNTQSIKEIK